MYVLVTYDVATGEEGGAKRLRLVAKICSRYGQRVQLSVFECLVDPAMYAKMKHELAAVIDRDRDSLRFYNLGKNWHRRVEQVGVEASYDPEGLLLL